MRASVGLAAVLVLASSVAGQGRGGRGNAAPPAPGPCDRPCLEGFVNQYLDSLVAHNAFGLPLAQKVRFSENDQLLDLGDGLWNVTTDLGTYKLYVSDPQSGQVGFFGTVRENGRPTALAVRLKVDNRKISEIETLVYRASAGPPPGGRGGRSGDAKAPPPPPPPPTGAAALEEMKVDPVFLEIVPADQRVSREELVKRANTYFDAIEQGNAPAAAFDPQCNRVDNGVKVAPNCAEQINSKVLSYIQTVYPRRPVVVDEERQLVFGFFMFQQPGDLLSVESPGRGNYKFPDSATQPGFTEVAQLFRIKDGKIRKMEALTLAVPYGTPNPFFNDDWRRPKK
ncbi:MAG: hypothetical protein JWO19_3542 [Bryobacterales bacterium]|nr:hypothetical protein [Bryobacterales bacterium]